MKFKDENRAKQLVVEIVSSEFVDVIPGEGLFFNDGIVYDGRYSHITADTDYPLIEQKLKSIVKLVNGNPSLVYKDLEEELWYMV